MAKPRIIIADRDVNYIFPLQNKFVEEFFGEIELEIITEEEYFDNLFKTPQHIDILIISEDMYDPSIRKHDIANIFLMTEQYEDDHTVELNANRIFKYTSIKEIFNEIISKSADELKIKTKSKQEPQIVLVYSASGGTGKSTVAIGVSAALSKNHKKVLYINAAHLQSFKHFLSNQAEIMSSDVYAKLTTNSDTIYEDIKHMIRKEQFNYLPPFKAALMSLGIKYSIFEHIALSAKRSQEYDYIIIDSDISFDEDKASLFNIADKIVIVTAQTMSAISATNTLAANVNGIGEDKYIFICNNFNKDNDNALISPKINVKFAVSDYVNHIKHCERMMPEDLANEKGIQRIAFLLS